MSRDPFFCSPEAIGRCVAFACDLGIDARIGRRRWVNEFLPGILVWRGKLRINPAHTVGYDDICHELGHLATLPSIIRPYAIGDVDSSTAAYAKSYLDCHKFIVGPAGEEDPICRALLQCGEAEAIAWGYAAQIHLGLDPRLILADCTEHETYTIMWELSEGSHYGVAGLAAAGMTTKRTFPKMKRWIQP